MVLKISLQPPITLKQGKAGGNSCCWIRSHGLKSIFWMDHLCLHALFFPAAATASPFLSSLVSKSSKPGCIYLWSWSRSFDAKGKGCQRTMSAVILAELEWSTTDMSYLTLSTCPGRSTHFLGNALPLIHGRRLELEAEA